MKKICLMCGTCFDMKAENHIYCSRKCRDKKYRSGNDKSKLRTRRFRTNNRTFIIDLKAKSKCIKCGETHSACLQFHHRDPKEKLFTIAHAITHGGVGIDKLLEEIAKCDIICANCHLKHHSENTVPWNIVRRGLTRGSVNPDKMSDLKSS